MSFLTINTVTNMIIVFNTQDFYHVFEFFSKRKSLGMVAAEKFDQIVNHWRLNFGVDQLKIKEQLIFLWGRAY
jgi:hypothetical protein